MTLHRGTPLHTAADMQPSSVASAEPSPAASLPNLDTLEVTTVMEMEASRVASETAGSLPPPRAVSAAASMPPSAALSRRPSQSSISRLAVPVGRPLGNHSASGSISLSDAPGRRSNFLSLQSSVNALTPPTTNTHTPRAANAYGFMGTGKHGLVLFQSMSATPAGGASMSVAEDAAQPRETASDDAVQEATHGPVALPMLDEKKPAYGAGDMTDSMDKDEEDNGDGEGGSHRDARERSTLEFNSFAALDSSFVSHTSSMGGGPGGGGGAYNTVGKAAFHVFKGNVGAGVFLLPTYYQDSGYILGMICVLLLGLLMIDCALALLHAKHSIDRVEVRTYPAVVDFVLGSWFRYFTDLALIFTQFGFCVMYIQYTSATFASLFDFDYAYTAFIILTVIAVTPMTFLSNKMHILAYASMVAGIFVGAVLVGTTAVDVENLGKNGVAAGVFAFIPTSRILVFLSGHMFSLEGIGIVLPVENSLAPTDRKRFRDVVKYTLFSIVCFYIFFGVLGYAAYGETLHTSVVNALPEGLMKETLQYMLGLSLIFGYPIQYVPAIQLVDHALQINMQRDRLKAYLLRVVLNVVFGVFALWIGGDALNIFASFLGAFAGVHLMITIPSLLALQLEHALDPNRENLTYFRYMLQMFKGPYTAQHIRCMIYLAFALVVWIGGMYFTFDSVFGSVPVTPGGNDEVPSLPPSNTTTTITPA